MPAKPPSATRLRRQLEGAVPPSRSSPVDALALAKKKFLNKQHIDLQTLAAELQISRATLYRWVGSHEQLLGEVFSSLAERAWAYARKSRKRAGIGYTAATIHRFLDVLHESDALQHFLSEDPEYALQVLTSKHSRVQARVTALFRELLQQQAAAGKLMLPQDLDTLAYALVRIGESFLYNDFITGGKPDLDKAETIIRALLSAPWDDLRL